MPRSPRALPRRLAALQSVTAALTGAVTPADVADVVLERGIALLGAGAGSVSLLDANGRLARLRARGAAEETLEAVDGVALAAPVPAAEVVRTGRAVWLPSPARLRDRYPALAPLAERGGARALAAVALVVRGRAIGALTLAFGAPHRFSPGDRAFAIALADASAVALDRASLFEAERTLRARAEETAAILQEFDPLRLLVDQVKEYAIFMLDPGGHVRTWNRGAERIKGYRASEIVGRHFSVFYPEADVRAGKPAQELATAIAEGTCEDEGIRVRKDGSTFWASVVITALRDADGTLRGFAKVTRDVTDRRRAEAERVRLARAEEGARARDEFLSIASHEFRTPITSLGLQVEMLLRRGDRPDDPPLSSARAGLGTIRRQTTRLARLVQALLDITHITAGRLALHPEPLDLAAVVRGALDRWRLELSRADCAVELHVAEEIRGSWDRERIEQVIDNLVANAVKFGAGRPVEIVAEARNGNAHLAIRDHGIGIAPDDQRRIFERFERAVPTAHYGGFGLGLWIARNIVQAHGGEIQVWSEPGQGTRFDVTLPRVGA